MAATLSGQLQHVNLASVFQNLVQNEATGILEVSTLAETWRIAIAAGRIDALVPGEDWEHELGRVLLRMGTINEVDLVRKKVSKRYPNLAVELKRRRKVKADDLKSALNFLQEEALYALFLHERGEFSFHAGERDKKHFPPPFDKLKLGIDPNSVMMEAARRSDELGQFSEAVGSMKGVYVLSQEFAGQVGALKDANEQWVVSLMDGTRDVKGLCRDTGLGRFQTCVIVSSLIDRRVVAPLQPEDHVRLGDHERDRGRKSATTFHYRKALELRRTDNRTRIKLAEVLADLGQSADAAAEFKLAATTCLEKGDPTAALEAYGHAAELAPQDLDVREKIFSLLIEHQHTDQAARCGEEYARLLVKLGLAEKARAVYERVLAITPKEAARYERAIAETYVQSGDVSQAVERFAVSAQRLIKRGRLDEGARLLESALALDSSRKDLAARLEEILSGKREARQKAWRTARRAVISLAVLLTALVWLGYNNMAARDYALVVTETFEDLHRRDPTAAKERMEAFVLDHPFTYSAWQASDQVLALDILVRRTKMENQTGNQFYGGPRVSGEPQKPK